MRSISIDVSETLLSILENEARKLKTTVPQLLADRIVYSFQTNPIRLGNRIFTVQVADMREEPEIHARNRPRPRAPDELDEPYNPANWSVPSFPTEVKP